MLVGREHIVLFLGSFGSGKTEVAVNFALHAAATRAGTAISLADLDLVNPYFRSREARVLLEDAGVNVIIPEARYLHSDLPILLPDVRAALKVAGARAQKAAAAASPEGPAPLASDDLVILDVGGDDSGARVIAALHDALPAGSYRAVMVLNASRPLTRDLPGVRRMLADIQAVGKIRVTGFACNTHLLDQTTVETVLRGRELALQAAAATGLPLDFVCAPVHLAESIRQSISEEVLPIYRFLTPPWARPAARDPEELGKALFRL